MSKVEATTTNLPSKHLTVQDVPAMLEQVEAQIKELQGGEKSEATVKEIPSFGKIANINDLDTLIKAASMVIGKEKAYKEAAKQVVPAGINVPKFSINGMSVKSILDHIKVRYAEVYNADKLKDLKEVKKMLEENLSAELKLAKTLEKIQTKLSKD